MLPAKEVVNEQDFITSYELGSRMKPMEGDAGLFFKISPSGLLVFEHGFSGAFSLWNSNGNSVEHVRTLEAYSEANPNGHSNGVICVAFNGDGMLATGSRESQFITPPPGAPFNTIKLWNISTMACVATLEGHTNSVQSVTFSPDGKLLASGSDDHKIKLWDISTMDCIKTLEGHTGSVQSVTFSPDGKLLASGSDEQGGPIYQDSIMSANTIKLWDMSTMTCVKTLEGNMFSIHSVAFSPSGLLAWNYTNTIRLWDTSSMTNMGILEDHESQDTLTLRNQKPTSLEYYERNRSGIMFVTFSPSGTLVTASGIINMDTPNWTAYGTIKLWDTSTGECIRRIETPEIIKAFYFLVTIR